MSGSNRLIKNRKDGNNPDTHREMKDEGVWPKFKGGFHMLHKIDGKLFAVGVFDTSVNAFSSVYLFYDPMYKFLNPGTLCALREIEYISYI